MDKMAYYWKAERVMKIGILTLHSQVNYGGVLQAYALQEVLKDLGHEVVVIDRWMDEYNATLRGITASRSIRGWVKFIGRALLGFGDGADYIRHVRTAKILPSLLKLTPYHFYHWEDAPNDLGVDVIIVGSDQVWNPDIQGETLPYLLAGAPAVPAIAYAASFGAIKLPKCLIDRYREGLKRFEYIGVREIEAVRIVESLESKAEHVVDPTLLADEKIWKRFLSSPRNSPRRKLVCYFINYPLGFVISILSRFSKEENCDIEVFFGGPCSVLPSSFLDLLKISSGNIRALLALGIHIRMIATPNEFVNAVAFADMVLTDSFHALMFSTIFRKDIRVLSPIDGRGVAGFARLREFCDSFINGCVIYSDIESALRSFNKGDVLSYMEKALSSKIEFSRYWIQCKISDLSRLNK